MGTPMTDLLLSRLPGDDVDGCDTNLLEFDVDGEEVLTFGFRWTTSL